MCSCSLFFSEAREVLDGWVAELHKLGLASADALFPRNSELARIEEGQCLNAGQFPVWANAAQVRAIVRKAFKAVGLPGYGLHVFRHMLTKHVLGLRLPAEDLIAFSINLGHERLATTFDPYGRPDEESRARLIAGLGVNIGTNRVDIKELTKLLLHENPERAAAIMSELARR